MHEGALAFLVAVSSSNKREEESPMKSENPTGALGLRIYTAKIKSSNLFEPIVSFFNRKQELSRKQAAVTFEACEPFDIEMELDLKKAENWLAHFGLYPYTQIHASGHLNYDDIWGVVETVQPDALYPGAHPAP